MIGILGWILFLVIKRRGERMKFQGYQVRCVEIMDVTTFHSAACSFGSVNPRPPDELTLE